MFIVAEHGDWYDQNDEQDGASLVHNITIGRGGRRTGARDH
jgi:hypothetical protein